MPNLKRSRLVKPTLFYPYRNFSSIYDENADFEKARFLILPIPYDSTTSYRSGTREGPNGIINASGFVELYDHEINLETFKDGIHTLPELIPYPGNGEKMQEVIYKTARELLKTKKTVIALGGDHSVSLGLIKAHAERHKGITVLQFDAHSDLRDEYEGTPFSSATVMRRVTDLGIKLTQVGLRAVSKEEVLLAKKRGIKQFYAEEMVGKEKWIEDVINNLGEKVYVSFDVDFFDAAVMPATGTPEPGGLGWYEATRLLQEVTGKRKVVGADFVEYSPDLGPASCGFTVAKLIYKMMGYIITGSK